MSLVIFCLLFSFVDYVPVKGEIIWYLSLTASSQPFYNREQSAVKGFEIRGKLDLKKRQHSSPGWLAILPWLSASLWNTMAGISPPVPQAVVFSSAPGDQLFSQEPGRALSLVCETKALTYTLLARLITLYLKLKVSNF